MDLERFLCDAARIPGVSGNEARIGAWLAEQFRPLADEVSIDRMQNVIARVGSEGPKVIICAHQDEIGLVVTNIDDDGAIRFYRNGGVDPRILPGLEVEIQTRDGALYGVVGAKAPHLLTREEAGKPVNYETLHIDVGLPADEVRQKVRVGDPIVMLAESQSLANGRMAGKTMDDRASVAAMLIAAEELGRMKVKMQAYFVSTAQEEVGSYGAWAAGKSASIPIGRLRLTLPTARARAPVRSKRLKWTSSRSSAGRSFIARSAKRWKKLRRSIISRTISP